MSHGLVTVLVLVAGSPLALAALPLLLELLLTSIAAVLPGMHERPVPGLAPVERLVIVVPGHNEERTIGACVRSLVATRTRAETILVVAHNCGDRTAALAVAAGARVARLDDPALTGKGNALAHGFALALGEYGADAVLVVDADSIVSPGLIAQVSGALSTALVVQARYVATGLSASPGSRLQALSFLCKNVVRARGRQRLGLSCGIFGNGFALRREVLDRVPYAAHSIVEDLEFHLALLANGISTRLVAGAQVLAEIPATAAGRRTQTARWEGGRVQMVRAHAPRIVRAILAGRLQMAEPLLDLLGLPIALEVVVLALLATLPSTLCRGYALAGFLTLAFHLGVGVWLSPDPARTAGALLQAPWYVVKKVALTPAIVLMAGKRAAWVKTSRATAEKEDESRQTR